MLSQCKIINPKNQHLYTIIILHGMYSNNESFNNFLHYFKNRNYYKYIYNSIKFIIPNSPIITLHYCYPYVYNVSSWYDYFTYYDGLCKLDKIGNYEFNYQSERIANIIKKEAVLLKNNKNIFIIGSSQGGTLTFNIIKYLPFNIGGIVCINSIYMNKYIKLNKKYNKIPIYIYSLFKDEIYPFKFQKKCYKILYKKNFKLKWYINYTNNHSDQNIDQYKFILNSLF